MCVCAYEGLEQLCLKKMVLANFHLSLRSMALMSPLDFAAAQVASGREGGRERKGEREVGRGGEGGRGRERPCEREREREKEGGRERGREGDGGRDILWAFSKTQ